MTRLFNGHPLMILLFTCLLLALFPLSSEPASMPVANREEGERYFGRAYELYCSRDYDGALLNLDRAIKQNTFLVDYYLMKGLVLHRTGRTDEAARAISYFLEVRPGDKAAPKILSRYREERAFIDDVISGKPLFTRTSSSIRDINSTLDISLLQSRGVKGMGKVRSSRGGGMAMADQLGDRLLIRGPGERNFTEIEVPRPSSYMFSGGKEGYALAESGKVFRFDGAYDGLTELGSLPFTPTDGAMARDGYFIAVSASARKGTLFSLEDLSPAGEVDFLGTNAPPEPSAVAVYGEWAAVADRNNDFIYIVSLNEMKPLFGFEADAPRDLAWSSLGDLYIVHDSGSVSKATLSFENPGLIRHEAVLEEASGAWSVFFLEDRAYCMDVSGFSLWEISPYPEGDSTAFISLDSPTIIREADRESFVLKATLSGPFQTYMLKNAAVATTVWNNRMLAASFKPLPAETSTAPPEFILSPGDSKSEGRHEAVSGKEALDILGSLWKMRGKNFRDLVVAASIIFSPGDLASLAGFCLQNGIRLSVYADSMPQAGLIRAAALTGGATLYNRREELSVPFFPPEGEIRIPLPSDETSSGFPSRSIISVYLDMGSVSLKDWMPLWPDLLQ
ncbi:MAG: hypothetical protein ACOYJV_05515 [Aminivibrio sp.]|jgi:hypothetical protein